MEMNVRLMVLSLIITLLVFFGVFFASGVFSDKRETAVIDKMDRVIKRYEDMQTIMFMSSIMGENATCPALKAGLSEMNKDLWDLGNKIDNYRQATEQFHKDPFYLNQKREFNRQEVLYLMMLRKMKDTCGINQTIVSFFFKRKEDCPDCDAQAFVLTDIKKDSEKFSKKDEIAIFSFDVDTNLTTVNLLTLYYNITEYPCSVIESGTYCGLRNKKELLNALCKNSSLSVCGR